MMKKQKKIAISQPFKPARKNKSTLFPLTFKVEENKVPLFFSFEAK